MTRKWLGTFLVLVIFLRNNSLAPQKTRKYLRSCTVYWSSCRGKERKEEEYKKRALIVWPTRGNTLVRFRMLEREKERVREREYNRIYYMNECMTVFVSGYWLLWVHALLPWPGMSHTTTICPDSTTPVELCLLDYFSWTTTILIWIAPLCPSNATLCSARQK